MTKRLPLQCLLLILLGAPGVVHAAEVPKLEAQLDVPSRVEDPPLAKVTSLDASEDLLARAELSPEGQLVIKEGEQTRALTIVPALQNKLTRILRSYETPWAAVVVMDPKTGRVLAMAEHSQVDPSLRGLTTKAVFPAASIFKIVTASALVEAGLSSDDRACSPRAKRKVSLKHLKAEAGGRCMSLAQAMGYSANGVFARLTLEHLQPQGLLGWAERFGFNQPLDFPVRTDISLARVPQDELSFAQTGAGFGDVFMSPLHGAALASVVANGGQWRAPLLYADETPKEPSQVVTPEQAAALTDMLEETVTTGTARRIFRERGYRVSGAVGKTGSLADKRPFRDYSWFVGFAPKEDPKVAVAAVIVNDYYWRIRATWLGREAMRLYLEQLEDLETSVAAAPEAQVTAVEP